MPSGAPLLLAVPAGAVRTSALAQDRAVPAIFWGATLCLALLLAFGIDLTGRLATQAGMLLMLAGGLPHGGHDLLVARTLFRMHGAPLLLFLAAYVAAAAAMAVLWWCAPLAAMLGFLALAAWHFSEDWTVPHDRLLRTAAGLAPIAATVLGQREAVSRLFAQMTDPATGALTVALVTLVAPVALLVALVAIGMAWQGGSRRWASAQTAALALLAIAPPTIAFPVYFALLHSRRHIVAILDQFGATGLGGAHPRIAAILLALLAFAGWALFSPRFVDLAHGIDPALAFQLLSVVAVPHLIFDAIGMHLHIRAGDGSPAKA
jgi:Brp/Blh family beta-carotene 15,15'-monooxygenase